MTERFQNRSPLKMLNINKTNKSTLQAKQQELNLGAEAGQEEKEPEGT